MHVVQCLREHTSYVPKSAIWKFPLQKLFLPVPNQLDKESLKQRSNKKDKPHKAFHVSCREQNDTKQTYHTTHKKKREQQQIKWMRTQCKSLKGDKKFLVSREFQQLNF